MLPHAARSFAASIVVLPREQARAAAVAYLYCRMLDTYEDLYPGPGRAADELRRFAARFGAGRCRRRRRSRMTLARDERDRINLLLVDRCSHVDAVFRTLDRTRAGADRRAGPLDGRTAWSGRPRPSPARAACSPTRSSSPATAGT